MFKARRRYALPAIDVLEGRKLLSVADPTFTFYPDGHVASEVFQDVQGHTFNETFNEAGKVTGVHATSADGSLFEDATYGYDANGTLRNREIIDAAGTDSKTSFRANGSVSSAIIVTSSGNQTVQTYSSAGQLTNEMTTDADGNFARLSTYSYYADGNIKLTATSNADGSGGSMGFSDASWDSVQVVSMTRTDPGGATHVLVKQDGGWWV